MIKDIYYLGLGAVLGVMMLGAYVYSNPSNRDSLQTVMESTLKVDEGCSSVALNEKYVLTADHCLRDTKGVLSRVEGVSTVMSLPYKVVKRDAAKDLALLEVSIPEKFKSLIPGVSIAKERCALDGDTVYLAGYPAGVTLLLTQGIFSGFQEVQGQKLYKATPPAFPGNSGGPLTQTCNGLPEIIGITSKGYRYGVTQIPVTHMHVFVSLEDIQSFLGKGMMFALSNGAQ